MTRSARPERLCWRAGCAEMVAPPRRFCSRACAREPALSRRCVECDTELPSGRRSHTTCSDACAVARRTKTNEAMRRTVSKPCEVCGAPIVGSASKVRVRTCGPKCLIVWRASRPKPQAKTSPCVVCAKPSVGRKTCSDDCHAWLVSSRSTGSRSESKRAARRKQRATAYRGKDKPEVIARLTAEQGGKCAICGDEGCALGNGKSGLVLDHCHRTGRPRAMLCTRCNAAIGLAREDASTLEAMVAYVRSWGQTETSGGSARSHLHSTPI